MARELDERRSLRNELETYLGTAGWTGLTFTEGWDNDNTITNPQVNVYFVTKEKQELEMGRTTTARTFPRLVQIDCYMESESRASAIGDDVMEFMDLAAIPIKDFQSNFLGTMICVNTEQISAVTQPPIETNPALLHWRAIIRGPFLAHYING